jgi:hypothetical protein
MKLEFVSRAQKPHLIFGVPTLASTRLELPELGITMSEVGVKLRVELTQAELGMYEPPYRATGI